MPRPVKLIQSSDPEAQRRLERNSEAIDLAINVATGVFGLFGALVHGLVTLATRETIGTQINIYENHYHVPPGHEPYHLGFQRNPAILNHRLKAKGAIDAVAYRDYRNDPVAAGRTDRKN